MAAPALAVSNVSRSFGSTRALRGVSFDVRPGEVHVLAGENGAGKTTLIRILSGADTGHSGTIRIDDQTVRFRRPDDARRAGIATIHQELSLVGSMTVADNLQLTEGGPLFGVVSRRSQSDAARRVLGTLGLDVDPDVLVESLPLSVRQLVEIARALATGARFFVMDEPTSALGEAEAERLFEKIEDLRAAGKSVVYISHRTEEIRRLADRITVLRDGERIMSANAADLPSEELVRAIAGQELETAPHDDRSTSSDEALGAADLRVADSVEGRWVLDGVSFHVGRGEIVGIAGLQGSGASELLHAVFGSLGRLSDGTLRLQGERFVPSSPASSLRRKIALVTNDRSTSVFADLAVVENVTLSSLGRFSRGGWISTSEERAATTAITERLRLAAPSLDAPASQLSGGNQQKVALARCLLTEPEVLLLDDPTRGVDVGAKRDIHARVRELASKGVAVVLRSSELHELLELCDRIVVLFGGRVAAVLGRADFSRERILAAAMGGSGS